jgi:hypothetical protein
MSRYEITMQLNILCPLRVVVEADSKEDALDLAAEIIAPSVADAADERNRGWKATLTITPPKGVEVANRTLKATVISQTSGGEKVKKLLDT